MSFQHQEQFRQAIADSGLTPPDHLVADGTLYRFSETGESWKKNGWYVFFPDGLGGVYGCWSKGINEYWRANIGRTWTDAEEAAHRAKVEEAKRQRDAEKKQMQLSAKERAAKDWEAAAPADPANEYLQRKGIQPHGIRQVEGCSGKMDLLVPMFANGELWSTQTIYNWGGKGFATDGRVSGCYYLIGEAEGAEVVCIAEGFATAATVYEATGYTTYCAFNAGNLPKVAQAVRVLHPDAKIIVCGDDDWQTNGNTGKTKASEAADAVFGKAVFPLFGNVRDEDGDTDFNDMAQATGLESVRAVIMGDTPEVEQETASLNEPRSDFSADGEAEVSGGAKDSSAGDFEGWQVPQPLTAKVECETYPLDALPPTIQAAVMEVQAFTKAPEALVAGCALSSLSVACQGHADVERAKGLRGTLSLYLLTIADSGERKSTVDSLFMHPIRDYEDAQRAKMKPELEHYAAEVMAWKSELEGVTAAIRDASKKGDSTNELRDKLSDIQSAQPIQPPVPRLLLGDETPENLAWTLSKEWRSAGVVSSEAGLVLGSRGMGKDSVMRNLGLLNILWDGGTLKIGRKTTESFIVDGVRLTMGLQVQGATILDFVESTGELARGTGFFARFLVANPNSTQGTRFYTDPPENYPSLTAFQKRISAILDKPLPFDSQGGLAPQLMCFTPEAKRAWVRFHDAIESQLGNGGELFDVRDVASKAADNVARIAALFQMFEHGVSAIGADMVVRASRLVAWHLNESRRFFGEIALPKELADAVRLERWFLDKAKERDTCTLHKRESQQSGPIRERKRLDAAIAELESLDRLREIKDGKKVLLQLNPLLLDAKHAAG